MTVGIFFYRVLISDCGRTSYEKSCRRQLNSKLRAVLVEAAGRQSAGQLINDRFGRAIALCLLLLTFIHSDSLTAEAAAVVGPV